METERLFYDTGRPPLLVRLMMSPFGLLALYGAVVSARQALGTAAGLGVFGFLMLSLWFWGYRFYYDTTRREIVIRSLVWFPSRLPIAGAISFLLGDARDPLTGAVVGTQILLHYADGREKWLTQVPTGDPGHVADRFSEATSLPNLPGDRRPSVRASLIGNTVIVGLMILGSFLWRQPALFLWPFRVFCVIALVGLWHQTLRGTKK